MRIEKIVWSPQVGEILAPAVEMDSYLLIQLRDLALQNNALLFGAYDDDNGELKGALLGRIDGTEASIVAMAGYGDGWIDTYLDMFEEACQRAGVGSIKVETMRPGLLRLLDDRGYSQAFVAVRKRLDLVPHGIQ